MSTRHLNLAYGNRLVEFDPEGGWLVCPRCGGANLRHLDVTVKSRPVEDGAGKKTVVQPNGSTVSTDILAEEFLGRRGEVHIKFQCESCCASYGLSYDGPDFELVIVQVKGLTTLEWQVPEN